MRTLPAACASAGDVVLLGEQRIDIARIEYGTPQPGKMLLWDTDGQQHPVSAAERLAFVRLDPSVSRKATKRAAV